MIQQSIVFGAGASNLPSVKHMAGFQKSYYPTGNERSGVSSQIKIVPSPMKRKNIALQAGDLVDVKQKKKSKKFKQASELGLSL